MYFYFKECHAERFSPCADNCFYTVLTWDLGKVYHSGVVDNNWYIIHHHHMLRHGEMSRENVKITEYLHVLNRLDRNNTFSSLLASKIDLPALLV